MRGTLKALVAAQTSGLPAETVATLNGLSQRIDTRLGEMRVDVQVLQTDIAALQLRMGARKSRVLVVFNLLALLTTLMLVWILYTQIIVVRHHRASLRRPAATDPDA